MSIAENLGRVRERIARAAEAAGRGAAEITLVGVTKYVDSLEAAELVAAGCTDLGESRPQELWTKVGEVASATGAAPLRWHLIGHLQRNKIRRTLPLVQMVHSVDSERLLAAMDEELGRPADAETGTGGARGQKAPLKVLLEVNTSGEAAKQGLSPDAVEPILAAAENYKRVVICGLMTMAALEGGPAEAGRNFATLRKLQDKLRSNAPACVRLEELSMGMSGDFEVAIDEGATIVRVGTALWEN